MLKKKETKISEAKEEIELCIHFDKMLDFLLHRGLFYLKKMQNLIRYAVTMILRC